MLLKSQMKVGARIFSFSWGTPGSDYSSQARDLDDFIYQNPDVLIIVAAGNSGEKTATGQGTISSPSGAKNVISVGASLNAAESFSQTPCAAFNPLTVASFSSAGPTSDGRLKPDVVAPGMSLVSSQSEAPRSTTRTTATCSLQGTSQATPVVTGMAVLLYEWLRDGWWRAGRKDAAFGMRSIPAALLKALIIHSSDSLQRRLGPMPTGPASCGMLERGATELSYPDVYQGYGKPNMSNLVDFTADATPTLFFLPNSTAGSEPRVAEGKEVRISFSVPRGVDLRATLVWTDPTGFDPQRHAATARPRPLGAHPRHRQDVLPAHGEPDNAPRRPQQRRDGAGLVPAVAGRAAQGHEQQFVHERHVARGTRGRDRRRGHRLWAQRAGRRLAGVRVRRVLQRDRHCERRRRRVAWRRRRQWQRQEQGQRHGTLWQRPVLDAVDARGRCRWSAHAALRARRLRALLHGASRPRARRRWWRSGVRRPPHAGVATAAEQQQQRDARDVQQSHVAAPVGRNVPHARADEQCPFCRFVSSDPVILVNHVEHMHS
ncbi:hypothetical protein PINS_up018344 [Pythium insidiosum]|nr:hypothetical protein PINS_up018344 [Pythium insidiosum]